LVDVSTSITTAGLCGLRRAQGGKLPGQWLLDKSGGLTDDPNALPEGGSILPIGGLDHGHKGFGLSLMVEALTQGLAGYGRADEPTQWGASVMVLVFDPVHFGGLDAFVRQTDWVSHACRQSVARIEGTAVRLPGQAGLEKKRVGLDQGVVLDARLASKLQDLATRFGLALRPALDTAQTSAPIAP
jgi:L-lactate dehydrogenase